MQTNHETEFRFTDADPYIRIQASRYETSFTATERGHDGQHTVKVVLPKGARDSMMACVITQLDNLRHADSDDQTRAIEWLSDAQSRIAQALRQLQPEVEAEA
jgi:hypothetical protein